ncbi:MAG: DUF4394 domain-containing protein [Phycisphaerales bacterium]
MHNRTTTALSLGIAILCSGTEAQELIYAVTDNQTLITWNSDAPNSILSGRAITGFQSNERVSGIDFRPATGELFAVGSFSNLYTIDVSTGAATQVGTTFSPGLNGSAFGFDFNPTIDRIRNVSNANQNLVLNPNTGSSTQVTDLFFGPGDVNDGTDPNVVASAYTNSFAGATSTQLYGIDTGLDILVTQANSAGTLGTVGALGIDMNETAAFDISGTTGIAYGTVQSVDFTRSLFWTVDLSTGASTIIGEVGGGAMITAMTVVPAPSAAMIALTTVAFGLRRRTR